MPRAVVALTALHVALLFAYSLLFPAFRPPDEAEHVDMVLFVRNTWSWPDYDEARVTANVARARELTGAVEFDRRGPFTVSGTPGGGGAPAAGPPGGGGAPPEFPPFRELGEFGATDEPNLIAAHPPLYHFLLAPVSFAAAGLGFWQHVWVLRIVSLLLLAPLPWLVWLAARWADDRPAVQVGAAAFPLAIPHLTHIGAAVNNDTLLVLLFAVLTVLLARVWSPLPREVAASGWPLPGRRSAVPESPIGDTSASTAVAVGLVAAGALLVKGFALVAPVWIAGGYLLTWVRTRRGEAVTSGLLAVAVASVVGGWWWLRNYLVFGRVQPGVSTVPPPGPEFEPSATRWRRAFAARMTRRFWGEFAYFDVKLPKTAYTVATRVVEAAAVGALVASPFDRRGRRWRWLEVLLLLAPLVGIGVLVAYGSWRAYLRTGLTPGIQGRYLFPGVPGLAIVVALGLWLVLRRWLPLVVLAGALVMQGFAVARIFPTYWASWDAFVAWAPVHPVVTYTVVAGMGVSVLWAFAAVASTSTNRSLQA